MIVCQLPVAVSPDDGCHTTHEQTRRIKGQGVAMMRLPKGGFKVGTPKKPEARANLGPEFLSPSCPMLPGVSGTGAAEGPRPSAKLLAAPGPALYSMGSCTVQSPREGSVGTSGCRSHWHRAKDSVPLLLCLPSLLSASYSDCGL